MKHLPRFLIIVALLGLISIPSALAQTSSNYNLSWWAFSSVGGKSTSANYAMNNNLGQFGVGQQSSTGYRLNGGFLSPFEGSRVLLPAVQKNACEDGWEIEPNNSYLQANGPLLSSQTICGYPNDSKDYFSFTSGSTGSINITLNNHTGSGVQLQLFYQSISNLVTYDYSEPYQINYTGAAGTYYIYIATISGFNSNDPGYNLTVTYP